MASAACLQRRDICRRRRGRRAQDVVQNVQPALHRRGPRRDSTSRPASVPCVNSPPRGLSSGSSTRRISSPSTPSIAVVFGQRFVQKRVIAVDQLQHAAVFAHDVLEIHLRFAAHGIAQLGVERVANGVQLAERCENSLSLLLAFSLFLAALFSFFIREFSFLFLVSFLTPFSSPAIATAETAPAAQPPKLAADFVKFLLLADGGNGIDVHVLDVAGAQPLAAEI